MAQPPVYDDTPRERNTNHLFLVAIDPHRTMDERRIAAAEAIETWATRRDGDSTTCLNHLARNENTPTPERSAALLEWMSIKANHGSFGDLLELQQRLKKGEKTEFDGLAALEHLDMHVRLAVRTWVKRCVDQKWRKELEALKRLKTNWITTAAKAGLREIRKSGYRETGMSVRDFMCGAGRTQAPMAGSASLIRY